MYQNSERKIIKFDILDCLIWGNIFLFQSFGSNFFRWTFKLNCIPSIGMALHKVG
jgi:hypothetical protein